MSGEQNYRMPSGMGGSFTVRIVEELEGGLVRVRIHMPRNPDWHGHILVAYREELTIER